jgi:hypothetical protein
VKHDRAWIGFSCGSELKFQISLPAVGMISTGAKELWNQFFAEEYASKSWIEGP